MSFIAAATLFIPAPPSACFARIADFPSWARWMPPGFRPIRGPQRALAIGDEVRVSIRGVPGPAVLRVTRVEPGRIVAWTGGVAGVLTGVHAFHFEEAAGGTNARSEELWTGALSVIGLVERRVKPMAEKVGRDQLEALARDLATQA